MRFLREYWWQMPLSGIEIYLILRFLRWYFDTPPKNLRVRGKEGREDNWQSTIVGPPDAA